MAKNISVEQFAEVIGEIPKMDWYVLIAVSGGTGVGKSCLSTRLCKHLAQSLKTTWAYDKNMTYSRSDLLTMIDGDSEGKGQLPEFSVILADELISIFYKRNWMGSEQKAAIELLNKCRDRHLIIIGCIPSFWDLDVGVRTHVKFWIDCHKRGNSWVFQPSTNPFHSDKWLRILNAKIFSHYGQPDKSPNYLFNLVWDDWNESEKETYYKYRNTMRVRTEQQEQKQSSTSGRSVKELLKRWGKSGI